MTLLRLIAPLKHSNITSNSLIKLHAEIFPGLSTIAQQALKKIRYTSHRRER